MRAIPQAACSDNDSSDNIKGIVYYDSSTTTPTTTGYDYTDSCSDETTNLIPHLTKTVSTANWNDLESATVGQTTAGLFKWYLNSTTLLVDWADPTLLQVYNNPSTTFSNQSAVIALDTADQWVYFVIQTTLGVPHPIHLHGHDFFVLAQGTGTYSSSVVLNTDNPPRRDTAMLPASGYLVIAFQTDNPGVWLMHCHIGWHTSEGFAVQFVERASEIAALVDGGVLTDTCDAWGSFQKESSILQLDSGI